MSAAGPRLRLRISVHTMPKDFGMQAVIANVGNFPPHISVHVGKAQQCSSTRGNAAIVSSSPGRGRILFTGVGLNPKKL